MIVVHIPVVSCNPLQNIFSCCSGMKVVSYLPSRCFRTGKAIYIFMGLSSFIGQAQGRGCVLSFPLMSATLAPRSFPE